MLSEPPAGALRIRDLGPLEVERAGTPVGLGGTRLAAALSLLLVNAGQHVGVDSLSDAMWGAQSPARSPSTLDSHIWRLRKALEPQRERGRPSSVLRHDHGGYRLVPDTVSVDSARFTAAADETRELLATGRAADACRCAERALGLWRGRPYAGFADKPWAVATVARLTEVRDQLRELQADALLRAGSPERALLALGPGLADTPLRERLWALRMLAQHRLGRAEESLRSYTEVRTVLLDELGLEPGPELRELHGRILAEDPALVGPAPAAVADGPPAGPAPAPTAGERPVEGASGEVHLPHRTSALVGREQDLAELVREVPRTGLTTLVGAAGCGKTRLAVEVARTLADRFPGGVWFVDLTATRDAGSVLSAVMSALASGPADTARPGEALRGFLRDRRALLVLDNCEQVLDPVAGLVDDWFRGPSRLSVLATSREPLEVDGERVHPVGPLAVPTDLDDASTSPAVALLLDRLASAGADREDLGLLTAAVRIATAVDGVPLALELAAGRARAFTLEEIAHQVTADPSQLARIGRGSDHHRTVRAAIEQSYAALPPDEAAVHRSVSALPGPFSVAAADAVHRGSEADGDLEETGNLVARLVHHSLLVPVGPARPGGPSLFTQLTTIRGHAGHAAAAEADRLRRSRDSWVIGLVRDKPPLGHVTESAWFDALDDDLPALRATLQHLLMEAPSAEGVWLAGRLGSFWYFRSKSVEGRFWAERALEHEHLADPLSAALVRLTLAHLLSSAALRDLADPHIGTALASLDASGHATTRTVVESLTLLTHSLAIAGGVERAREVAERVRTVADTGDEPELHLFAEICAAHLVSGDGLTTDEDLAALHRRALDLGNVYVALLAAGTAVIAAIRDGDPARGLAWSDRMVAHRLTLGNTDGPVAFELRGLVTAMSGRPREAVRLFSAARTQALRNGLRWPAAEPTASVLAEVTRSLEPAEAERLRAAGATLTLADVLPGPRAAEAAPA
ncbi:AfsR/SARP family transcriptional regulator [Modestobacter versicolor]|uniref:AfsR/SARP family transcriptional regulator n=1 Tax=Modestobacter versicolor TaxID=429133 RepID=UPI0015E8B958|nr:BTAD domain-containing putative transcriptional regulator [Modestobacter versicolor]